MYKCRKCDNTETFKEDRYYTTKGWEMSIAELNNEGEVIDEDYTDSGIDENDFDRSEDLRCGECDSRDIDRDYEESKQEADTDGNYW